MVLIAGDGRDCLSGFHAANMAAAFAAKDLLVNLFERSALLPNAGYFMSLPPGSYLPWVEFEGELEVELGGVHVDCSPGACVPADDDRRRPRIDIIHLPPLYPTKPFRAALREVRTFDDDVTIFVMLRIKETSEKKFAGLVEDELGPDATCVLHLGDPGIPDPGNGGTVIDLGHVTGWKAGVGGRVPAILRDPDAPLSREFASVVETLLVKINQLRRNPGAEDPSERRSW